MSLSTVGQRVAHYYEVMISSSRRSRRHPHQTGTWPRTINSSDECSNWKFLFPFVSYRGTSRELNSMCLPPPLHQEVSTRIVNHFIAHHHRQAGIALHIFARLCSDMANRDGQKVMAERGAGQESNRCSHDDGGITQILDLWCQHGVLLKFKTICVQLRWIYEWK